jgi:hypothetical protein
LTARPPAVDSLVVVAHPLPMMNRIRPHRLCEERGRGSEPPDFLVATEVIVIADQTWKHLISPHSAGGMSGDDHASRCRFPPPQRRSHRFASCR